MCFINVYTYPNPKPTPYSNTDALNIVVHNNLFCEQQNVWREFNNTRNNTK